MGRILLNWLLLMTIAAAASGGRDKRHLSYIKNFIISLFGHDQTSNLQLPILTTESQYEFYRIPGFNEILIKTLKYTPNEITITNKSGVNVGQEVKVNPFEYYMGTKNIKETDAAFQNVYKLFSTGILGEPEFQQDIMVPIMIALHDEAEENDKSARIHPDTIKSFPINEGKVEAIPIQTSGNLQAEKHIQSLSDISESILPMKGEEIKPKGLSKDSQGSFELNYSSQSLEKDKPLMSFTAKRFPEVTVRQNIITTPNLPRYIKQSLGTKPFRSRERGAYEYIYEIDHTFIPFELKYLRSNVGPTVPLNSHVRPLLYFKKPVYIGVLKSNMDNKRTFDDNNILKSSKSAQNVDYFLINADLTKKVSKEEYSYNKSKATSNDEIITNVDDAPNDKLIPQVNHRHLPDFDIVKEKEEISTPSPFMNNYVDRQYVKSVTATTTTEIPNITTTLAEDKGVDSNVVKTSEDVPKSVTLSQYIYDHVDHNKTRTVSILKEKDEVENEFNTDKPSQKDYVSVSPIVDKTSMNLNNFKIHDTKFHDNRDMGIIKHIPKDKTLSEYIYKRVNYTNAKDKLRDKSNTHVDDNSLLHRQLVYISPKTNEVQAYVGIAKTNDGHVNLVPINDTYVNIARTNDRANSNDSIVNIVPTNDNNMNIVRSNDSHINIVQTNGSAMNVVKNNDSRANFVNFAKSSIEVGEANYSDADIVKTNNTIVNYTHSADVVSIVMQGKSSLVNEDNELKTNIHTISPLDQEASFKSSVSDKGLKVNSFDIKSKTTDDNQNISNLVQDGKTIKTNVFNDNEYVPPITNSPPVNFSTDQIRNVEEIVTSERVLTFNIELSRKKSANNAIMLKDNTYVSHSTKSDGNSITVNENQAMDSDIVNETLTNTRGDIPDQ